MLELDRSVQTEALRSVLADRGVIAGLALLNDRTDYRYTGIYRFDGVFTISTSPANSSTRSASIIAFSANDAPVSRWHQRQWQQCTNSGPLVSR